MSQRTRDYWVKQARNVLKSELARRGINYEELEIRLRKIGVRENANNLRAKINRGTFSAFFFLQVLNAIGCKNLNLEFD